MPSNKAARARIAVLRKEGKPWGRRPKITDEQALEARKRINAGEGSKAVAASYGVSKAALYKRFGVLGI